MWWKCITWWRQKARALRDYQAKGEKEDEDEEDEEDEEDDVDYDYYPFDWEGDHKIKYQKYKKKNGVRSTLLSVEEVQTGRKTNLATLHFAVWYHLLKQCFIKEY